GPDLGNVPQRIAREDDEIGESPWLKCAKVALATEERSGRTRGSPDDVERREATLDQQLHFAPRRFAALCERHSRVSSDNDACALERHAARVALHIVKPRNIHREFGLGSSLTRRICREVQ